MKKKLAIVLTLVMMCTTMLTACDGSNISVLSHILKQMYTTMSTTYIVSNSKVVGTWEMTSATAAGVETIDELKESGSDLSFVFEGNGKVKVFVSGEEQGEAEWEENDDIITIKDGSTELTLTITSGKLILEQMGATMTFEKN